MHRDIDKVELTRSSNDVDQSGAALERIRWPDGEEQRMIEATIAAVLPEVLRFGHRALTFRGCRIAVWTIGPKRRGNRSVVHVSIQVCSVQGRLR